MIDRLDFKYYWPKLGLREEDLACQPKGEGRNCKETITHLYDLSNMILSLTKSELKKTIKKVK